jgi:hypothetical protein
VKVKLMQDTRRRHGSKVTFKDVSDEEREPYRFIKKMGITFRRTEKNSFRKRNSKYQADEYSRTDNP